MRRFAIAFVALATLAACSKGPTTAPGLPVLPSGAMRVTGADLPAGKINHIVFIVQENRTFDNIFGGPRPFREPRRPRAVRRTTATPFRSAASRSKAEKTQTTTIVSGWTRAIHDPDPGRRLPSARRRRVR